MPKAFPLEFRRDVVAVSPLPARSVIAALVVVLVTAAFRWPGPAQHMQRRPRARA